MQRVAIGCVLIQTGKVFLFDEISSYLDIKQRLRIARVIREITLKNTNSYVIVIEHDLAVIDFLSDYICCFYGIPGAYGIVSIPFPVREGLNIFLSGYISKENVRFRDYSIKFFSSRKEKSECISKEKKNQLRYPSFFKTFDSFKLYIEPGNYSESQITVLLGENGTGKTSFVKLLGGIIKPDVEIHETLHLKISYKPQKISPNYKGCVDKLVLDKIGSLLFDSFFKENIFNPLGINFLMDKKIEKLSGGELQRLSLALCLSKNSDLYLIDEPSAYLDTEQRLIVSKVIKKFIISLKKPAFIVEHDFIMAAYLADQIVVFEGIPSLNCKANCPQETNIGINNFLKQVDITFRRDPVNDRPRINKHDSIKDRAQKLSGNYYFTED